jgi:hypothetical protein
MTDQRQTTIFMPISADMPLLAMWIEMWMWPINMMAQISGCGEITVDDKPEIDRECDHLQLPVPNPIQESKDSEIFA